MGRVWSRFKSRRFGTIKSSSHHQIIHSATLKRAHIFAPFANLHMVRHMLKSFISMRYLSTPPSRLDGERLKSLAISPYQTRSKLWKRIMLSCLVRADPMHSILWLTPNTFFYIVKVDDLQNIRHNFHSRQHS